MRRRLDDALSRRIAGWLLLALLAAVYLAAYAGAEFRPGPDRLYPEGWWGWWDQGKYLAAAEAVASGTLDAESHWYPMGYGALASPFLWLLPEHAFLIPNLAMTLGIGFAFFRISRVFLTRSETLVLTAALVVALRRELELSLVIPWNSIPTHLISYVVLLLHLRGGATTRRVVISSLLASAALWFRPVDAICLAPALVASTLEIENRSQRFRAGLLGVALIGVSFLATRALNLAVFDDWYSAYELNEARIGFFSFEPLRKLFSTLLDGGIGYRTPDPTILQAHPWLLLALPGVAFAARRIGWKLAPTLACMGLSFLFYSNYNYFSPSQVYRFTAIHYLAWLLPLAGLFVFLSSWYAWREQNRMTFVALAATPVLLASVIDLREVDRLSGFVDPDGRVVFDGGEAIRDGARFDLMLVPGRFEVMRLAADGRELKRFREFNHYDGHDGTAVVFAKRPGARRYEILEAPEPGPAALVGLEWTLRFPNSFLRGVAAR